MGDDGERVQFPPRCALCDERDPLLWAVVAGERLATCARCYLEAQGKKQDEEPASET